MEKKYTPLQIIQSILGKISPTSDSGLDIDRLDNLKSTIDLTENLIDEIINIARYKGSYECSVNKIGTEADDFITRLREKLEY